VSLPPGSIVITGASSGLGAALALRWAAPGRHLALAARNATRLADVVAACRARGAAVTVEALDVAEAEATAAFLARVEAAAPIGTLVANAGTSWGDRADGTMERAEETRRQIAVNALGVVNTIAPLLPALRARRRGRIAVIASLAAHQGSPYAAGYSASKAAALRYAEALRARLAPEGIRVSVVQPGFFDSALGARYHGPRPLRWSLDAAAERIGRGIEAGEREIVFPRLLAVGLGLMRLLPPALSDALARRFRFTIDPP
jgi:short-subunit dehydrogenase